MQVYFFLKKVMILICRTLYFVFEIIFYFAKLNNLFEKSPRRFRLDVFLKKQKLQL